MRIFLICPVCGVSESEREEIAHYVKSLEDQGDQVHWPERDTNQLDTIGLRICRDNMAAIDAADTVHVWWNNQSQGSLFDLGMAFHAGKMITVANKNSLVPCPDGKCFQKVLAILTVI